MSASTRAQIGAVMFGAAISSLALSLTSPAVAQTGEFTAKQVRILIGFGPGGGYDQYARVIGRYIDKHLPGKPSIVPQNMPGAGSLTAANTIYANSPKDGSVFNRSWKVATFALSEATQTLVSPAGLPIQLILVASNFAPLLSTVSGWVTASRAMMPKTEPSLGELA